MRRFLLIAVAAAGLNARIAIAQTQPEPGSPAGQSAQAVPDKSQEELTKELEKALGPAKQGEAPKQESVTSFLKNPQIQAGNQFINLSAIWTQSFNYFSDTPTVRQQEHEPYKDQKGFNTQLQELELGIQAYVDPHVKADIFLAFHTDGVEIEEGYLTTLNMPADLQLKAGKFKAPFGRFNPAHFLEVTPFVDAPLVSRRFFGGEGMSGLGAQASVLLPVPWYAELTAALETADSEVSFGIPSDDTRSLKDFATVANLKQYWDLSDSLYFQLGGSYAQGPNDSGGSANWRRNRTNFWGGDLYLKWRDLSALRWVSFQSEYMARSAELPGGRLNEGGMYSWLDFRANRNWEIAARFDYLGIPTHLKGPNPPVILNTDLAQFHTGAAQWRTGAALSYYFSEFFRLRLQYNYDKEDLHKAVNEVFGQFQFVIGAHGAHPF